MAKSPDAFHQAAGTSTHGMYGRSGPGGGIGNVVKHLPTVAKAVAGVAKKVVKTAARGADKVITGVENRMKKMDASRVERNTAILKSQGHTWESYNQAMVTPKKKK